MSKINKLGKSTFVIAILSFILVAVLAFGGTYAYFSATTGATSGSVTMGSLKIDEMTGNAVTDANSKVFKLNDTLAQPNQTILSDTLSVTVDTNISYYTRVKLTVIVEPSTEAGHTHKGPTAVAEGVTEDDFCNDYFAKVIDAFYIDIDESNWHAGKVITEYTGETDEETGDPIPYEASKVSSKYYYQLKPSAPIDDDTSTQDKVENNVESFEVTVRAKAILGNYNDTADGCTYWMDAKVTIKVTFEVLQADYLDNGYTVGGEFKAIADDPETQGVDETKTAAEAAEAAWEKALGVTNTGNGTVGGDVAPAEEEG